MPRNIFPRAAIHHGAISVVLSLAAFAMAPAANAQSPEENKTAVQDKFDAWRAGTGSPFELLAEDARWTIEGNSAASKAYPNREAFLADVIRPFNARMSVGLKPTIRSIIAEDDRVVILFDAQGTARDGKPYINTYVWFFKMRSGSVVEANAFFDAIAFDDLWSRVKPAP